MSEAVNPEKRRRVMAAFVWAVLLLCIGGAALLIYVKGRLWGIDLADPRTIGSVQVSLPKGWDVSFDRESYAEEIVATEGKAPNRRLTVRTINDAGRLSPMELLLGTGMFPQMGFEPEDLREEDVQVPGGEGYIIHPLRGTPVALIRTDDGRAVTVQVQHRGQPTASDEALIYEVTKSIRLQQAKPLERQWRPRTPHEI